MIMKNEKSFPIRKFGIYTYMKGQAVLHHIAKNNLILQAMTTMSGGFTAKLLWHNTSETTINHFLYR